MKAVLKGNDEMISNKGTTTSVREIRKLSDIDINEFRNDIASQIPKANDLASLDDAVESYKLITVFFCQY